MLSKATNVEYSAEDFLEAGDRIFNVERLFNLEAGLSAEDDTLPRRLLDEPIPSGPAKGKVARLDEMLDEYYSLRGWDEEGRPSSEKIKELDL